MVKLTLRDGVPNAVSSSAAPLVCPSSPSLADETGEGRPFRGTELSLIVAVAGSCSSGPSLLGTGVSWVLGTLPIIFFCKEPFFLGLDRSGRVDVVEAVFGVF